MALKLVFMEKVSEGRFSSDMKLSPLIRSVSRLLMWWKGNPSCSFVGVLDPNSQPVVGKLINESLTFRGGLTSSGDFNYDGCLWWLGYMAIAGYWEKGALRHGIFFNRDGKIIGSVRIGDICDSKDNVVMFADHPHINDYTVVIWKLEKDFQSARKEAEVKDRMLLGNSQTNSTAQPVKDEDDVSPEPMLPAFSIPCSETHYYFDETKKEANRKKYTEERNAKCSADRELVYKYIWNRGGMPVRVFNCSSYIYAC